MINFIIVNAFGCVKCCFKIYLLYAQLRVVQFSVLRARVLPLANLPHVYNAGFFAFLC